MLGGDVLNVLRWPRSSGDDRRRTPRRPRDVQPFRAVPRPAGAGGQQGRAERLGVHATPTCAAAAPMRLAGGVEHRRSRSAASSRAGEPFVYAYYDGIDKIAHERGFGAYYDAELRTRRPPGRRRARRLPPGAALLVTADHGQVDVGERDRLPRPPSVLRLVRHAVGRGPLPLAARPAAAPPPTCWRRRTAAHGDVAWVVSTRADARRAAGSARSCRRPVAARLGDVALVAREPVSFDDPADSGPFQLVCRHGSLTSAEMLRAAARRDAVTRGRTRRCR